ncbi:SHOCT domain-containing protein [Inquilinus limosus]|uniref:SHOCT domain-containing protein n=1 Tax=Inquilinus limosus TaxID=171674 RepID=UPI000420D876|nr:SHOCT domain-containing protein [Inquilinus limosus]
MRILPFALALGLALPVAACGGSSRTPPPVGGTTTGQELIDLDNAYRQGAITQDEYEEQREKILER